MNWFILAVILLILVFGFVVAFGPPYLPTRRRNVAAALDLLNLKSGETLLELGSGDGRVALAAAKRGWRVVGIELNPLLVIFSKMYTWRYRRHVRILWGSYFVVKWPPAEGIFTFMISRHMAALDKRIAAWHKKPLRLASFAFQIPSKKPAAEKEGVFLYEYR